MSKINPEPQLIAEAIAAFTENNKVLKRAKSPLFRSTTFPGITMIGTTPTFYKIPVTTNLISAIANSRRPSKVTTVERFIPTVPSPENLDSHGMKPLENRRIILQCFEAFKQFVVSYSTYLGATYLSSDGELRRRPSNTNTRDSQSDYILSFGGPYTIEVLVKLYNMYLKWQ